MNFLEAPEVDDEAVLEALAANELLGSYPQLQAHVERILQGYGQYADVRGNCFSVANVLLPPEIENYLRAHFADPPNDLRYVTTLRMDTDFALCPMCGSLHSGSLDHLLPKQQYAAFAMFSKNLVPACKCNSRRGNTYRGAAAGERVLHPYFDACLADRLVKARFEDLGPVPKVDVELCVDVGHPNYPAIAFHFQKIVRGSRINGYLSDRWMRFCRKPRAIVRNLHPVPASVEGLAAILQDDLELTDEARGGKNNWDSIFTTGLLAPPVLAWLYEKLSVPGRSKDDPLINETI